MVDHELKPSQYHALFDLKMELAEQSWGATEIGRGIMGNQTLCQDLQTKLYDLTSEFLRTPQHEGHIF